MRACCPDFANKHEPLSIQRSQHFRNKGSHGTSSKRSLSEMSCLETPVSFGTGCLYFPFKHAIIFYLLSQEVMFKPQPKALQVTPPTPAPVRPLRQAAEAPVLFGRLLVLEAGLRLGNRTCVSFSGGYPFDLRGTNSKRPKSNFLK